MLQPFQYQLGNVVFGRDTDIIIKNIAIQPYNVNSQDFQLVRSDEVRFGIDTLAPSTILFELSVLNNYALEPMEDLTGESTSDSILGQSRSLLTSLADEWKSVETRRSWGAMQPLLFCDGDGVVRQIYGRPGKFTHAASLRGKQWIDVQAEFRRADTYAYSNEEKSVELALGDNPVWFSQEGDAPAWFRILFYGPVVNPTVNVGGQQIYVETSIDASTVLEISSYPWARRVVDDSGVNHRTKLRGSTQYLDELRISPKDKAPIRWTDPTVGLSTWSEIESTKWEPNPWFGGPTQIPWDTYSRVSGQKVGWSGNRESGGFLSSQLGGGTIIDEVHYYQTPNQFAQVSICETDENLFGINIADGRTMVCVLGNADLSQYAGLELEKNNRALDGRDYIRLFAPSGLLLSADRGLDGLKGGDVVSIQTNDSNKTVTIKHNGLTVLTYTDTTSKFNWVNTRQGFMVNRGNLLFRDGCRVNNLVAHDVTATLPNQEGRCFFLWRDAYNVI